MKKLFLILWILIFGSPTIFADGMFEYATGKFNFQNRSTPMPSRKVEVLSDSSVRVTYMFTSAQLVSDRKTPESFYWKIGGFGLSDNSNNVAVPLRRDNFVVPKGKTPLLTINTVEYKDFSFRLCKGEVPNIEGNIDSLQVNSIPDRIVGGYTYFPSEFVGSPERNSYRDTDLYSVIVAGIRYIEQPRNIQALTKLVYTVSFVENDAEAGEYLERIPPTTNIDDNFCRTPLWMQNGGGGNSSGTSNPGGQQIDHTIIARRCDRTYMILTTEALKDCAMDYIHWKKSQGYNVVVKSRNRWTYDVAKAEVDQAMSDYPDLYYLLIIGDARSVEGKYISSQVDRDSLHHYTDRYFSFQGSRTDKFPDISVGRIPTSDPGAVKTALSKIITYEKYPLSRTGVGCCANFQDLNNDQYEDHRFTLTSEEIYNYINQNTSFTAKRLYGKQSSRTPAYWNSGSYSNGRELPEELRNSDFMWQCSAADIASTLSRNCAMFIYRGHGDFDKWVYPRYTTKDIAELNIRPSNTILLSICCNTGRYELPNSFAEKFLSGDNSGCTAMIAGSSISYSGYNDAFIEGMIDAIWPSPGLIPQFGTIGLVSPAPTPAGLIEIGQIMNHGLLRMTETYGTINPDKRRHTTEVFHLFGDPSMIVHTTQIKNASEIATVNRVDSSGIIPNIEIECEEPCYIGVYNKVTGVSRRHYGKLLNIWDKDADSCIVTIYNQNLRPYVSEKTDFDRGPITLPDPIKLQSVRSNNNYCNIHIDNVECEENASVQLVVRNNYGTIVRRQDCDGQSDYTIDISDLNSGIYIVSLVKDENIMDSKHFVK